MDSEVKNEVAPVEQEVYTDEELEKIEKDLEADEIKKTDAEDVANNFEQENEIPEIPDWAHPSLRHFVKYIHKRLYLQNKNMQINVVGEVGSGKSYLAISLASAVDPTFDETRVAFSPLEFIKLLRKESGLRTGHAIVLDEAGVNMSSREWQKRSQIDFNKILQTFRHRNLLAIFTLPHLSMLDKQSRELGHCIIECTNKGIKRQEKVNDAKCKLVETNAQSGKPYFHYIHARLNNSNFTIKFVRFKIPDIKLRRGYERKKEEFTTRLNENVFNRYEAQQAELNPVMLLTPKQRQIYEKLMEGKTLKEIATEFKIAPNTVATIRTRIMAKGIKIPEGYGQKLSTGFRRVGEGFTEALEKTKGTEI